MSGSRFLGETSDSGWARRGGLAGGRGVGADSLSLLIVGLDLVGLKVKDT